MRKPGSIYRQYRQMRKLAFIKALSAARKRTNDNCFYGRVIDYLDDGNQHQSIKLCMLKEGNPDVCSHPDECNAFARKWSDEEVSKRFSEVMSDSARRKRLFPELWAYEWVLDKSLTEAMKSPNFLAKPILWLIIILESILKAVSSKKTIMTHGGRDGKA